MNSSLKTALIVIITLIALFICIFFSIKLLSTNIDKIGGDDNNSPAYQATDGDTLELIDTTLSGEEVIETIRLLCVNTPELGEEGYEEAKDYLSSLIAGSIGEIRIERAEGPDKYDKYNRTLAWVYINDSSNSNEGNNSILINKIIIDEGYGDVYEYEGTNCSRVE